MRKIVLPLCVIGLLAGCSTSGDYQAYLAAQTAANRQASEAQKPLVKLTAQPGQQITGLASLEVYTPVQAQQIQQARPNEWAAVVSQGLSVVGTVGGIVAAGRASVDLATAVGTSATAGYKYVQAPAANVTTTTDASMTTTTTTTSTVGDNSGANAGNSGTVVGGDMPTTTTTTSTDNTATPTVVTQPDPIIVVAP